MLVLVERGMGAKKAGLYEPNVHRPFALTAVAEYFSSMGLPRLGPSTSSEFSTAKEPSCIKEGQLFVNKKAGRLGACVRTCKFFTCARTVPLIIQKTALRRSIFRFFPGKTPFFSYYRNVFRRFIASVSDINDVYGCQRALVVVLCSCLYLFTTRNFFR